MHYSRSGCKPADGGKRRHDRTALCLTTALTPDRFLTPRGDKLMFGIFGKKRRPEKAARTMPDVLHFKDNQSAFRHVCKWVKSEIREKQALIAILCDPADSDSTGRLMFDEMSKGENIYNAYIAKIA